MTLLRSWLAALPGYLWGGWGAIASLLLLVALWEFLAGLYGPLVLPTPLETADTLRQFAASGGPLWPTLAISARRALAGLALAVGLGSVAGVATGTWHRRPTASSKYKLFAERLFLLLIH